MDLNQIEAFSILFSPRSSPLEHLLTTVDEPIHTLELDLQDYLLQVLATCIKRVGPSRSKQ